MTVSSRRSFLSTTSAAAAGLSTGAATRLAEAAAINRVRLGLIGCGGRGRGLARSFAELSNVELAAVADPDEAHAQRAVRELGGKPALTKDLREILDDKTIDAVIVATPDHWHTPAALLAVEAGKHVYVEKPCSHNLREGRLLVEAARRSKRLVQHGTQSRSDELIAQGIQMLERGAIGKVLVAKAWNVQRRGPIGNAKPSNPPPGFDYDLWTGPAPMVPFQKNRHHYTWHWWYNFGTGDMGNDGVHELDIARWGLGVTTHPSTVSAIGGKYAYDDDQQFPDTQYVSFEYPGEKTSAKPGEAQEAFGQRRQLVFEMRLWSRYGLESVDNGNAFYGTNGWMLLSKRGILKVFDERNKEQPIPTGRVRLSNHFQNFVDAIRETDQLRAEILVGHLSASLCHLGNASARLGRSLAFDPKSETVASDAQANRLLTREYRNHWGKPKGV